MNQTNQLQEVTKMRDMLKSNALAQGTAWTGPRKRMLERELTMVRFIGARRGNVDDRSYERLPDWNATPTLYNGRGDSRGVESALVETYNPNCFLLPEALGEDGNIHVLADEDMRIGILFARAPSPNINEKRHITPSLLFKQNSCVLPNTPMSTGTRGISSAPANIVYGPGASDIILEGEGTFVDCFPGRLHSDYHGHVNKVDELVVNKQERVRSADLVLRLQGAKLPDFREPTPVESPMIASRGVGIGGSYAVDVTLPIGAFDGSESPEDNYEFPFVFD